MDIEEDSLSQFPDEVDFRKRQNLCRFSFGFELERENFETTSAAGENNFDFIDSNSIEMESQNNDKNIPFLGVTRRKSRK